MIPVVVYPRFGVVVKTLSIYIQQPVKDFRRFPIADRKMILYRVGEYVIYPYVFILYQQLFGICN